MPKADNLFVKQFVAALGLLAVFIISIAYIATYIGNSADDALHKLLNQPAATAERIAPVGKLRIEGDKIEAATASAPAASISTAPAAPVAPATVATAGGSGKSGEQLYTTGCVACHAIGLAGAPKLGDNAAWAIRAQTGIESMLKTVITGKGVMPPMGGTAFSAEELETAIRYMLEKSGITL